GGTAAGTGAAGSIAAGIALPKVIAGVATVVIAAGGAVTAAKILPSRQEPGETAISAIDVTAETGTTEAFSAVVFPFSLPPLPEVSENKTYASRQRLFDAPETRPAGLNATAPAHTSSQAAASAESATTTSAAVNTTSRAATTAATVSSAQTTTTTTTAVKTTTAAAGSLIPDPGLEAAIRFELVKQTGELTKSDLAKVKQLFIRPGSDLRSFEGIRNCTSLENLVVDASGGARPALDTMDLSGMVALKEISLFGISLKQLNVSGCTSLTGLSCAELGLQTIEVRGCTALETLLCGQNNLASLDISGCTGLTMMNCSMNKIASLDVRGLMRLRQLVCFQNSFPSRSAIIGLDQLPGLTLLVFDPQN
ncbi:MAG: hypothetical protein FWC27_10235, partial [Firmicutes bacterium]|nr:hypothetical protein [Bacillota bacterium]